MTPKPETIVGRSKEITCIVTTSNMEFSSMCRKMKHSIETHWRDQDQGTNVIRYWKCLGLRTVNLAYEVHHWRWSFSVTWYFSPCVVASTSLCRVLVGFTRITHKGFLMNVVSAHRDLSFFIVVFFSVAMVPAPFESWWSEVAPLGWASSDFVNSWIWSLQTPSMCCKYLITLVMGWNIERVLPF